MNIALISFMVLNKGPKRGGERPAENLLKEKFKFDDAQMLQFDLSRDEHKKKGRVLKEKLNETSRKFYNSAEDTADRQALLDSILSLSKEVYLNNENHFNDMRAICKKDQLDNIESFIDGLMDKDRPRRRPMDGRGKKGEGR